MQNLFLSSELTKGSSFILAFFFSRIVQFSRCRSRRLLEVFTSSSDLFIIPHFQVFVKPFLNFFEVFSNLWFFRSARLLYLSISLQAFLLYHISDCLSRGFSDFFKSFPSHRSVVFRVPALLCDSRPAWQQTCLLYHISDRLSRGFFKISFDFS